MIFRRVAEFIAALYDVYVDLHFTYMEINPLVVTAEGGVFMLDLAAKIDATADFLCRTKWGDIEYPPPFGRDAYPEEAYIADLDSKSGASLKLTILNRAGRIWTMVAGGGASVIYSDTICDLGGASELANYGEYSGAPSEQQTYEYAKTILSLMTQDKHPDGKVLISVLFLNDFGLRNSRGKALGIYDVSFLLGGYITTLPLLSQTFGKVKS